MKEIIFAGGSHYGVSSYKSLWPFFEKIYLIKDNPKEITDCIRESDCIIDGFESVDCNYVFLGGYPKFITQKQLEKKTYINIHGALLPKYRGMHGTFYAIMNDEKKMGITFHLVDRYMDSGDIIAQFSFDYNGQIIQSINDTIDELVYKYAGITISDYLDGKIKPSPQDEELAIYGARRNLEDCLIDFSMPNFLLRRFFKALTPNYPYPMLQIREELYEVLPEVTIVDRKYYGPLGRAVFINGEGTWINVVDGFIVVKNVRKFGEKDILELSQLVPIGYRFMDS